MSLDETSISRIDEGEVRARLVEALDLERLRSQDLFGSLVESAATTADAPVAVVGLVDQTHVHTVSAVGAPPRSRPCEEVLGCSVVERGHTLIIEDLRHDERFPGTSPELDGRVVCFYFGQPLLLDRSIPIGTLTVVDFKPRRLSVNQRGMLTDIARQIELQLEYIVRQDGALEHSGLAAEIAASRRVSVRRQALTNYLLHDVINAATAVKADTDYVRSRAEQNSELNEALDDIAEA
ncbi:MAG: GAF domain-containing protein, partial [Persicimonas sp.]